MTNQKKTGLNYIIATIILLFSCNALANESSDCLECHEETNSERVVGYDENLALSIHQDFSCIDCHADLDGVELVGDQGGHFLARNISHVASSSEKTLRESSLDKPIRRVFGNR